MVLRIRIWKIRREYGKSPVMEVRVLLVGTVCVHDHPSLCFRTTTNDGEGRGGEGSEGERSGG
jgi:hypothetical protein